MHVMELLAPYIGVPAAELLARHRFEEQSGDHTRLTWGPGSNDPPPKSEAETQITTYAHTDFGSVTLLFNWLGGLQIENQATGGWDWVRPIPGHAIYNMGDALVRFSGGQLKSGRHRVLAAPGDQSHLDRYSVCIDGQIRWKSRMKCELILKQIVYFVRPEDEVYLEDITPQGKANSKDVEVWKAKDWIMKKARLLGNAFNDPDGK